jgi:hypothetical protein
VWWLTTVILATQEVEIRGLQFRASMLKSSWDPISTSGWVLRHVPVIPAMQEAESGRISRGWDLAGLWFQASLGKKLARPHHNQWIGVVVCTCRPSYMRKHKQEDHGLGPTGHKVRPRLNNNQCEGWGHGRASWRSWFQPWIPPKDVFKNEISLDTQSRSTKTVLSLRKVALTIQLTIRTHLHRAAW